jgi:hypothetical protein
MAGDAVVSLNAERLRVAAERLASSDALAADDRHKASIRNRERNAAIIASLS